jgi:hypothetical protein
VYSDEVNHVSRQESNPIKMSTLFFTICAKNYIGLAKVLGSSVAWHGREVDFRIYVADGCGPGWPADDPIIVSARDSLEAHIEPVEYSNMSLMYNVTEFCTALKAACFMRGFADGYEKCVYLDPDTFLTASVEHIERELDSSAILITPHLCLPVDTEGPRADHGILATGVYNLGFLGLRRGSETDCFLSWWHTRLRRQAFNDHYHALYTDQRWIDFVPSLFSADAVKVWRHLGCNVAPWNYHEREISRRGEELIVKPRDGRIRNGRIDQLVFLHFSGFDFRKIANGDFTQLNLPGTEAYEDLQTVYALYAEAISKHSDEFANYLSFPYEFERFVDGTPILPSHRRLFRVWVERNGLAADPFGVGGRSFHAALAKRALLSKSYGADLAMEKATARSISQPGRLLAWARMGLRLLFRVVGRARFFFLIRSLNRLSQVEQHYDTFRLEEADVAPLRSRNVVEC